MAGSLWGQSSTLLTLTWEKHLRLPQAPGVPFVPNSTSFPSKGSTPILNPPNAWCHKTEHEFWGSYSFAYLFCSTGVFCLFLRWDWGLNSGLCAYKASALMLQPSSPCALVILEIWVSQTICLGWSHMEILPISAFQVARSIDVSHQCPVVLGVKFMASNLHGTLAMPPALFAFIFPTRVSLLRLTSLDQVLPTYASCCRKRTPRHPALQLLI
jgi:hypothetical protein